MRKEVKLDDERKTDGLSSFATIALPMLKKVLGKKGMVGADVLSMWEHIVGEEIASYTFPEKIEFKRGQRYDGVLKLKVPAGGFALEVQHREKIIVEKINLYFGYNAVSSKYSVYASNRLGKDYNNVHLYVFFVSIKNPH